MALLEIDQLVTEVDSDSGCHRVVDGLDLQIDAGETLGLVGESGCGKSMTALSIMRLLPQPGARIHSGQIRYGGRDIAAMDRESVAALRGSQISMIFQDPMTALNPVQRIGQQIGEMLALHDPQATDQSIRRQRVLQLLQEVGIPDPESRLRAYPHQLSGGMRQRVVIAMALACNPRLLIADEPTTALDVTIQAQIIALIKRLQAEHGMAMLFITHDLGLVAQTCQRVAVMYAGKIVEVAPVAQLFQQPRHPYTQALIAALPSADKPRKSRLSALEGQVPAPGAMPAGCRFANRCAHAKSRCREQLPPLESCGDHAAVACIRWRELDS